VIVGIVASGSTPQVAQYLGDWCGGQAWRCERKCPIDKKGWIRFSFSFATIAALPQQGAGGGVFGDLELWGEIRNDTNDFVWWRWRKERRTRGGIGRLAN
jgi:hypothetical protein